MPYSGTLAQSISCSRQPQMRSTRLDIVEYCGILYQVYFAQRTIIVRAVSCQIIFTIGELEWGNSPMTDIRKV